MSYYNKDFEEVLKELETNSQGLSNAKAKTKLNEFGENKLKTEKKIKDEYENDMKSSYNEIEKFPTFKNNLLSLLKKIDVTNEDNILVNI